MYLVKLTRKCRLVTKAVKMKKTTLPLKHSYLGVGVGDRKSSMEGGKDRRHTLQNICQAWGKESFLEMWYLQAEMHAGGSGGTSASGKRGRRCRTVFWRLSWTHFRGSVADYVLSWGQMERGEMR